MNQITQFFLEGESATLILEEINVYKLNRKNIFNQWLLKLKVLNSQKLLLKLLVAFSEPRTF